MTTAYPRVDRLLAEEVRAACGVAPDADVETIVRRFREWLPAGSTAKWAALDRGERVPGEDPATALEARLGGSLESWTCWPYCTGLGAVLAEAGHDVRLMVEQLRAGRQVPDADHHSVLVVDGALLDPYLGPSAPIPAGGDVTRPDAWGAWVPGVRPDHLGARAGGSTYRYRQLADHLDGRDVRAFGAISATHSGIGRRRTAHWLADGRLWFVRESDDGAAVLQASEGGDPFSAARRVVRTGRYEELRRAIDEPVPPT